MQRLNLFNFADIKYTIIVINNLLIYGNQKSTTAEYKTDES